MPSVKLQISPAESGHYLVVVSGEGFYGAATNAKVGVRIKGDDEWFDETLFSLRLGFPGQVLRDGGFVMSETVLDSRLDEDWGQDEIYALVNVDGFQEMKTNVVKGRY